VYLLDEGWSAAKIGPNGPNVSSGTCATGKQLWPCPHGESAEATPLEAVAAGLERASSEMGPRNRDLGPRMKAAIAASSELQERDALKSVDMAAAMTAALEARGVPETTAHLASEMGVLAFKQGYTRWSEGEQADDAELAPHALAALEGLRKATASLG
jgi:hypothetical protein